MGEGASLCPAENSDRGASPCLTSRLPGEGLTVAGEAVTDEPLNPLASPLIPRLTAGAGGEGLAGVTWAGLL